MIALSVVALLATAAWLAVEPSSSHRLRRMASGEPPGAQNARRVIEVIRRRTWPGPAQRRRRATERMRTVHGLSALAAELEAGQPPSVALRRCADEPALWPHALAALHVDADVPSALRADAVERPVLGQLAACWQVAADSGAGLAASVGQLARSARTAEDTRVALEAELAGPRSTARLLSLLPLVGLAFGTMMGADPTAWLMGTSLGRLCCAAAAALIALGTFWTGRIAAAVERLM